MKSGTNTKNSKKLVTFAMIFFFRLDIYAQNKQIIVAQDGGGDFKTIQETLHF